MKEPETRRESLHLDHVMGFLASQVSLSNVTCNSKDLKELEGFLKGLESGISGWGRDVSSDCCNWTGVNCSSSAVGVETSTESGKRVGVEKLNGQNVLLLISNLDISPEEVAILKQIMYTEEGKPRTKILNSKKMPIQDPIVYEVVWLPVVVDRRLPWTEDMQRDFDRLQSIMPWYSVQHPSLVHPGVIKYIKEFWHFNRKPILVVLDPHGRVVRLNALHMTWIWGSFAFPFTRHREEELWREETTWRLERLVSRRRYAGYEGLVDGMDENVLNWIERKAFICLYGGDDIDWIRKFTTKARAVAQEAGLPFEMMYVGERNTNKERVRTNIGIITSDKLSYCWEDPTLIWYFWIRLESMWYSKMQQRYSKENDSIMKGIITMLIFDSSDQGWALISERSKIMVKDMGDTILKCFNRYDSWKENVGVKGSFIQALRDQLEHLRTTRHHCIRLTLPETEEMIPEIVGCSDCRRIMKKSVSVTYSCYED
ncbi:protein SIEVE ELEMENT OCCLUSION B-like [Telopea speciosissima]|uniref:protein SIEVE ELEMENT OCCLUSION B-like n=1 Tax=Telopea speciosissima TaxID=54955 RepID=UPI001CC3BC46|nr:protein SIEVE ELEMENT OCCLUSION B-like [Telopea speciosissima]